MLFLTMITAVEVGWCQKSVFCKRFISNLSRKGRATVQLTLLIPQLRSRCWSFGENQHKNHRNQDAINLLSQNRIPNRCKPCFLLRPPFGIPVKFSIKFTWLSSNVKNPLSPSVRKHVHECWKYLIAKATVIYTRTVDRANSLLKRQERLGRKVVIWGFVEQHPSDFASTTSGMTMSKHDFAPFVSEVLADGTGAVKKTPGLGKGKSKNKGRVALSQKPKKDMENASLALTVLQFSAWSTWGSMPLKQHSGSIFPR